MTLISEVSKNMDKLKDELWSAYQPLQTLYFTEAELLELSKPTVSMTRLLYTDVKEFIEYRGIAIESDIEETESEEKYYKESNLTPWYYNLNSAKNYNEANDFRLNLP